MQAIKFTLSGRTAFFKKPDVNSYLYFTYGNIHKIALLGILGAIDGLKGYNFQGENIFPEFYEKLCGLKIAIVPKNEKGYISKKVQTFNNSVGYASRELGGNLIIKEQWLENPEWDIYILLDENQEVETIKKQILTNSFAYIPYLGKNDHFANITTAGIVDLKETKAQKIDSLYMKKYFEIVESDLDSLEALDKLDDPWKYEEKLPILLEEETNQYIKESFVFTNMQVEQLENCDLYQCDDKVLFFF